MTQNNAIVKVTDVQLETIKHPKGDRLAMRDAKGKFAKTALVHAQKDVKDAQKFLAEVDPEHGKSRKEVLREALYKGAIEAAKNPKGLGNSTKVAQFFEEESGNTKAKESLMTDDNMKQQITTVQIFIPPDIKPMEERPPEKTKPSFAEVLGIETAPKKE
jgi:hypothetical protein